MLKAIAFLDNIPQNLIVSTGFAVLHTSKQLRPKFLYYAVSSEFFIQRVVAGSKGVAYPAINASELANFDLYYPDYEEQEQILDFIDQETSQINSTIEKYEKLIKLLKEKRIALISHAVTKGLNPNVKMKDSGVEWIGEIPEHWEVKKIKRMCQVKRGASPRPITDLAYFDEDGEYAWVRIEDVTASNRYLEKTTERLSEYGKSFSVPMEPDSLFLSIAGTVGSPIITKIKCCIHDGFVYFVNLKQNPEYWYYIFLSGELYKGLGKLGTQLNLNTETVGMISMPVPLKKEQEQIADYLDQETSKIDQLLEKINKQIEQLSEYKTSLISHAVTGKIDLRGAL